MQRAYERGGAAPARSFTQVSAPYDVGAQARAIVAGSYSGLALTSGRLMSSTMC